MALDHPPPGAGTIGASLAEDHASAVVQPLPGGRSVPISGEIVCPPDKSITHRSVMLAAMAAGESRIISPLLGADCRSTMSAFRALGVTIEHQPMAAGATNTQAEIIVRSPGWDRWESPLVPLDFGNSGTTARLLAGLLAATPGLFVTYFGDASLSKRPMGRVVQPLREVGAQIYGRDDGQFLPMAIAGQVLRPRAHVVDKATAQVKSALLLAGLNIPGVTSVRLPAGSRDHTERMLKALGASVEVQLAGASEIVSVRGPFRPQARVYRIPGDPSSAAFFAVLGAITTGQIKIHGVLDNPTRNGFLKILRQMGAHIEELPAAAASELFLEPVVDLVVSGGRPLQAIETVAAEAPTFIDEVPILAVAALFATGRSCLRGLGELRVKESDRLAKVVELINLAGGEAYTRGDDLHVVGQGGTPGKVRGFHYDPAEDHRLAMAAAILAKTATAPSHIKDPQCVAVSFPTFFAALGRMG